MVRLARETACDVPGVQGDLEALPFRRGALDGVWSGNQGRSLATTATAAANPTIFPAGGVLFGDSTYPSVIPTSIDSSFPNPNFPLAVQSGQTVSDWNPHIKPEYVESWTSYRCENTNSSNVDPDENESKSNLVHTACS